jgi:hypothetical protein
MVINKQVWENCKNACASMPLTGLTVKREIMPTSKDITANTTLITAICLIAPSFVISYFYHESKMLSRGF